MALLLDAAIFLIFAVLFAMIARPRQLETRDVQVWTDKTERRLLARLPPHDER